MKGQETKYKKINMDKAEKLAMAGAKGIHIAAYFGVHPDTLYDRVVELTDFSEFSAWLQDKRAKGDSLLLTKQYDVAMTGDRTMLVWLGKQRLEQADKREEKQEINLTGMPYNDEFKPNGE